MAVVMVSRALISLNGIGQTLFRIPPFDISKSGSTFGKHGWQSFRFVDGNKRTAWLLVEILIDRSGYHLDIDDDAPIDDLVVAVAAGELGFNDAAFVVSEAFDQGWLSGRRTYSSLSKLPLATHTPTPYRAASCDLPALSGDSYVYHSSTRSKVTRIRGLLVF